MILWLLVSAAAPPSEVEKPVPSEPLRIDVLVEQPKPECEESSEDEIVVCAGPEDNERHRLRPIPNAERYEKDESKAEFSIGDGAVMAVETDVGNLGGGVTSPRLMVRIKIPF